MAILHEDIILEILSVSHAIDVTRFGMTCRSNETLAGRVKKDNVDANKILTQFFEVDEVLEFRKLQQYSGAIISGLAALQLLGGQIGLITNLDLYVGNEHRCRLREFLRNRFEWEVLSREQAGALASGQGSVVSKIIRFKRHFLGLDRTIHCLVTADSPVEAILLFKLTCAMNFFTHESAYSLFPIDTFDSRKALINGGYEPRSYDFYYLYQSLGWEIQMPPLTMQDSSLPKVRYFGDAECWKVQDIFPTLPLLVAMVDDPVIEYLHSFRVFYNPSISIQFSSLFDWSLRHTGTYADDKAVKNYVDRLLEDHREPRDLYADLKRFLDDNYRGKTILDRGKTILVDEEEMFNDLERSKETLEDSTRPGLPALDEYDSGNEAEEETLMEMEEYF